jgi:hypothetical protein
MQALEQWLDVATSGLCESAAERVRAEISEHYLSAIESAGEGDCDSADVERRAVASLGDAKAANRQYRRVLLTKREDALLRELRKSTSLGYHVVGVLILATMAIYAISVGTTQFNFLFAAVAIKAVLTAIPISTIRAGRVVRILRWGNEAVFYAMWFATMVARSQAVFVLAAAFLPMPLAVMYREYKLSIIRRKLPVGQWPRRLWI